jgi:murein DD-endopeptidase MepM/ murein hydrolase activator NlpD
MLVMSWRTPLWVITAGVLLGLGYFVYQNIRPTVGRSISLREFLSDPQAHPEWSLQAGTRCGAAPFVMPTDGFVAYLWDDVFSGGHHHQGIDIFGGTGIGLTPVVAAYPGYITRLPGWKSAVIERIPSDPLEPDRQIWLYYTHMADPAGNSYVSSKFPPGTSEVYVDAGTLLGYQGDYTGDPNSPTGVHLHFSVVKDDGKGGFLNELDIHNTYDPSPYLGLALNADTSDGQVETCTAGR